MSLESLLLRKLRFCRADGEYRWFRISAAPIYDAQGHLVRWCGINIDIDDRKRAEQKLQQNEESLHRITQTIPGMLWCATPEGAVDYCNRPWLDFASMTVEQAQGWGWADAIHPHDREGLVDDWRSSLASGTPLEAEARMRRFDGSFRWFLFRANALRDESGTAVKWWEQVLILRIASGERNPCVRQNCPGGKSSTTFRGSYGPYRYSNCVSAR